MPESNKQKKARKNFKDMIKEAKHYYKEHPDMKWKDCIKHVYCTKKSSSS